MPAPGMGIEQIGIDAIDEHLDAGIAGRNRNAEFGADGRQQFFHRLPRIEYVSHITGFGNLLQQTAAYRRLARPHLAGEQHKPAAAVHAIQQMCKRLLMTLAHVEIAGIRCDRKRRFGETKVALVHGRNSKGNIGLL